MNFHGDEGDVKKLYSMGVPYTAKQMNLLKDSLTLWLVNLGVFKSGGAHSIKNSKNFQSLLKKFTPRPESSSDLVTMPTNFAQVLIMMSNSLLLIRIVETILE